jgi:hypothetical protein
MLLDTKKQKKAAAATNKSSSSSSGKSLAGAWERGDAGVQSAGGSVCREDSRCRDGREEGCSIGIGLLAAVHGLSEGPAQQKCSPALAGSRALDQRALEPERCLPLLHERAFARPLAAPHDHP